MTGVQTCALPIFGVTVGFEDYVLEPGDSISFESSTPHRLHNDGEVAVHAIWVVLGRYHSTRSVNLDTDDRIT